MSLIDAAMSEMKTEIIDELERKVWERLEPRIQQELHARHMSIAESAKYLHVSEPTVRRLVRDQTIPSFRVRGLILLRQSDVDAWVERQITEGGR